MKNIHKQLFSLNINISHKKDKKKWACNEFMIHILALHASHHITFEFNNSKLMTNIAIAIPYKGRHKLLTIIFKEKPRILRSPFFVLKLWTYLSLGKGCFGFLAINPSLNVKLHEFQLLAT